MRSLISFYFRPEKKASHPEDLRPTLVSTLHISPAALQPSTEYHKQKPSVATISTADLVPSPAAEPTPDYTPDLLVPTPAFLVPTPASSEPFDLVLTPEAAEPLTVDLAPTPAVADQAKLDPTQALLVPTPAAADPAPTPASAPTEDGEYSKFRYGN